MWAQTVAPALPPLANNFSCASPHSCTPVGTHVIKRIGLNASVEDRPLRSGWRPRFAEENNIPALGRSGASPLSAGRSAREREVIAGGGHRFCFLVTKNEGLLTPK